MLDPRQGRGLFSTFHARYPFARWSLDHVFFSERFLLADMQRLDDVGSDHFLISVSLCLAPHAPAPQETSEASKDDHRDAREAVEAAR